MEHFLSQDGYLALALLALIQACFIPIPSEVTLGFAGVLAGEGRLNLALVIVIATVAELAGSFVAYGVSRLGGRPLAERFGRYLLVRPVDLDHVERWLEQRGELAIAAGRALPLVRAFASVVAGAAKIPPRRFAVLSLAGTLVFVSALASIGYGLGTAWQQVAHSFSLAGYVLATGVVGAGAVFVVQRQRNVREPTAGDE